MQSQCKANAKPMQSQCKANAKPQWLLNRSFQLFPVDSLASLLVLRSGCSRSKQSKARNQGWQINQGRQRPKVFLMLANAAAGKKRVNSHQFSMFEVFSDSHEYPCLKLCTASFMSTHMTHGWANNRITSASAKKSYVKPPRNFFHHSWLVQSLESSMNAYSWWSETNLPMQGEGFGQATAVHRFADGWFLVGKRAAWWKPRQYPRISRDSMGFYGVLGCG